MERNKNIFAFCNQKGGVGKTTSVINLAAAFSKLGLKTLVVDADPQGNATSGLGIDKSTLEKMIYDNLILGDEIKNTVVKTENKNLDLIPSNANLAGAEIELAGMDKREYVLSNILDSVRDKYNLILIDCPPSLGLLTINALVAADHLVIPLQCEYYALEGLGQLLDTYNLIKERLNNKIEIFGVILTMADFRTKLTEQVIDEVKEYFQTKVFGAVIPRSIKLSEAPGFGKPGVTYAPECRGSISYAILATEFLERTSILKEVDAKKIKEDVFNEEKLINLIENRLNMEGVK